jgi:hypothetical protein
MIEVAIVSMEQALEVDGEELPAGSGTLERDLLELPGATAPGATAPGATGPSVTAKGEAAGPVSIDPPLPGA